MTYINRIIRLNSFIDTYMKHLAIVITAFLLSFPAWGQLKLSNAEWKKLENSTINSVSWDRAILDYPRQVGKNAKKDIHGWGPVISLCVLNSGDHEGIGEMYEPDDNTRTAIRKAVEGHSVAELIDTDSKLVKKEYRKIDIAIYDLIGVILNKPAYRLFGKPHSTKIPIYTGMIYLDDIEFADPEEGMQRVLDNCRWDYEFGYRQFKLKTGRGFMWMNRKEGLERDIEITRRIHEEFPDVAILVDANDAYTINETIAYLEAIKPLQLYWIEEPFRENVNDLRTLKVWKLQNAPDMLITDGEFKPNHEEMMDLARKGLLDVFLQDIIGYGFTNWIELLPQLKEFGVQASPHCWKSFTKTIYAAYFGMIFGDVPTIEGATCFSKDIDLGGCRVENGWFIPSDKPGFGITRTRK